jgi:hypothetical protein
MYVVTVLLLARQNERNYAEKYSNIAKKANRGDGAG